MAQRQCDRCGRELGRLERQYIAIINMRPTVGVAETDEDPGDRDHLLELHEMLEGADDAEDALDEFQPQEFLLCHACCAQVRKHPLPEASPSREAAMSLGFSEN